MSEELLEQARSLTKSGKKEEARMCLLSLLKEEPENIAALLMLGGSYFEVNELKEAKLVFQQLIRISPGTGLYSIALFNACWRLKETDEAFEEIRRFILIADKETEKDTIAQYLATLNALDEKTPSTDAN